MKKIVLGLFVCILICSGCQKEDVDLQTDMLKTIETFSAKQSKKAKIVATEAGSEDILCEITDKKEVSDFIDKLNIDKWKMKTLPDTANKIGTFTFYQEETIKFGEAKTDRDLISLCEIDVYEDSSCVALKSSVHDSEMINLVFEVPQETVHYLAGYFY